MAERFRLAPAADATERKIIIGLIVSTQVIKNLEPIMDKTIFQASYARRVAGWVLDYFAQYKEAPEKHIQDIFDAEAARLDPGEAEVISALLDSASKEYTANKASFNAAYLEDQALRYFKERSLATTASKIQDLLAVGKLEQAEKAYAEHKKVIKYTSGWVNPFDPDVVASTFDQDETKVLMTMPGALGDLLGKLRRDWLVGIMGPMKRGKSWVLMEFAVQALLNKLRAVYISLEMTNEEVRRRMYKRLTAAHDISDGLVGILYPCLDCQKNQIGQCTRRERINRHLLRPNIDAPRPQYDPRSPYTPCTWCRENDEREFLPDSWWTVMQRPSLQSGMAIRAARGVTEMYGDRLRVISYPTRTANLARVLQDLVMLEHAEGFVPDVVVVDYADILAPEDSRIDDVRERTNETWQTLKQVSTVKHGLTVVGTQSNRKSMERHSVKDTDTSEDIRKLAHVDVMVGLNQLPREKKAGVWRFSILEHRHRRFNTLDEIMILQQLEVGQPILGSTPVVEWQ